MAAGPPRPVKDGDQWSLTLPVRGDARCIVPDGNSVYCNGAGQDAIRIWAPNGRIQWTLPAASPTTPAPHTAPLGVRPMGLRAGMVYVARTLAPTKRTAGKVVAAIDRRNGKQVWSRKLLDTPTDAQPALPGIGMVFARTEEQPELAGLDPKTGVPVGKTPSSETADCGWTATIYRPVFFCTAEDPDHIRLMGADPTTGDTFPLLTLPHTFDVLGSRGTKLYVAEYRPEDFGKPFPRYTRLHVINVHDPADLPVRAVGSYPLPGTPSLRPSFYAYDGVVVLQHQDGTVSAVQGSRTMWTLALPPAARLDGPAAASWGRNEPAVALSSRGLYVLTPAAELFLIDPADGEVLLHKKYAIPKESADGQPRLMVEGGVPVGLVGRQLFSLPTPTA